ncbi:MAG TPA: GNAT family N-acetyltransferase [Vicinamibacterales bacterium]|nr:GNAT family N-acetyltransferase [Vicinamibacterales bacterium]
MTAGDIPAVDVRRSTPEDFDGFYRCFAEICRERRFLALVDPPAMEQSRAFLEDARRHGMVQYVAAAGPLIVGWCDVIPHRWEGFRHGGRLGMGIAREFRGNGIGRRLLDAAVRGAREAGLSRVELDVFSSNTSAVRLYERYGFVREGLHRKGRIIDGRVEDVLMMGLLLDD